MAAAVMKAAREAIADGQSRLVSVEPPDVLQARGLSAGEERDRSLQALKELEFDHRTGKLSDEDYRELVGPLRRRAAALLEESRARDSKPA